MQPIEKYNLLIKRIDEFIRKFYLQKLLRGIIFCGAGILSGYLLITAGEYWGQFGTGLRSLLFYGYLLLNVILLIWLIFPPLLAYFRLGKIISHDRAAEIIGEHFQEVGDKLLNTLQLKKLADENPAQWLLIEAGINQKIDHLKPITFPSAINIRDNLKYIKWIILPFSILILLAFTLPSLLLESTNRLLKHNQYFAPKSPFQFVLLNKQLSTIQGENFVLNIKLDGNELPENVYLEYGKNIFKLDKESISRFHYTFSNLQRSIRFSLKGGDLKSETFEIEVRQKPAILKFDIQLQFPPYLNKKPENLQHTGDLLVPEGTRIIWKLTADNTDTLYFGIQNQLHKIIAEKGSFSHQETMRRSTSYYLKPINQFVASTDSAFYQIQVIIDQAPTIRVEEKTDSVSNKAIYFHGSIHDDYGFSSLRFHYQKKTATDEPSSKSFIKTVKTDLTNTDGTFFFFWNLNDLQINPGDEVTYFFEIADNDGINGPKKSRSPTRTLRMPTEMEINEQLDQGAQAIKQKMQGAIKLSGKIVSDAKKVSELLLNKNSLTFEEKKQVSEVLQKRSELENVLNEIKKDNAQNSFNRKEQQTLTPDILDKQKQIEELFNHVLDEKTKDLLRKLEEMLQQNEKSSTQDEITKMQFDSKFLQKELDRMLALYKQLEFEQKLNENISTIKQLAERQQELANQTAKSTNEISTLKKQQEALKIDFKILQESLKQLQRENEQLDQKNIFDSYEKEQEDIRKNMKSSADDLTENNRSKAKISQQNASNQLESLAKKLEKTGEESEGKSNEVNINQLREILKGLLNSSFAQEKLMETLRSTHPFDPKYVTLTQTQKSIKDNMKTTADSLFSLSKRVPQIQSTINREMLAINSSIDKSLENLGDRITAEANQNQQYSMTSMNNLALLLNDVLQQLQNAKSGSGKKKQTSLSQLNKMQQQLNQNMQKMRDQIQQRGNTGQQIPKQRISEQMAKMARQQQMIRQALQEINQQQNKDGIKGLGDLDKIAKQMEQTETDLVNKRILEETLKRQREIQTLMLIAENAEQQREQDQNRESNSGKDFPAGYSDAFQGYKKSKKPQTEQLRTVSPALNYFYKLKIKTYFDKLKITRDGRN